MIIRDSSLLQRVKATGRVFCEISKRVNFFPVGNFYYE